MRYLLLWAGATMYVGDPFALFDDQSQTSMCEQCVRAHDDEPFALKCKIAVCAFCHFSSKNTF